MCMKSKTLIPVFNEGHDVIICKTLYDDNKRNHPFNQVAMEMACKKIISNSSSGQRSSLTMFAKSPVIPRTILYLGVWINVKEWAILVVTHACKESEKMNHYQ